jgi:hypothetical protein
MLQTALNGHSWLEALAWVAALAAAFCAAVALRQQAKQSRAALLLTLYDRWESLLEQRWAFTTLYKRICDDVLDKHAKVQPQHQMPLLREAFAAELKRLNEENDPQILQFVDYLNFFETLGHYVRRRYIPFKVVRSAKLTSQPGCLETPCR